MTDPQRANEPEADDPLVETRETDPDLAETATNDAVAGETVLDQPGSGWGGPTGGAPAEEGPYEAENDLADEPVEFDDDERI